MPPRPKLIYFAERRPEMDREAFRARWREHARLGMSMPRWSNVHRYVHCDAVEMPDLRMPVARCDGVAAVWYRDEAHRRNHIADRSADPVLKRDELETFARPVRDVAVLTEEHLLLPFDGERRKLFLKIRRNPQVGPGEFRAWWRDILGPGLTGLLKASGAGQGYAQNLARTAEADGAEPLCDCVDEIAARNAARVDALLAGPVREIVGFADHVRSVEGVWTEETVLYPAAQTGTQR